MDAVPWTLVMGAAISDYNAALADMHRAGAPPPAATDGMNAVRALIDQPQLWQVASQHTADADKWARIVGVGTVCARAAAALPPASLLPSTL